MNHNTPTDGNHPSDQDRPNASDTANPTDTPKDSQPNEPTPQCDPAWQNNHGAAQQNTTTSNKVLLPAAVFLSLALIGLAFSFVFRDRLQNFFWWLDTEPSYVTSDDSQDFSMPVTSTPQDSHPSSSTGQEMTSEQIAEKVMPSVVGIVVYTQESARQQSPYSEGSGIIMTEDGYIITNAHVVLQEIAGQSNQAPSHFESVDKIEVYLDDDTALQAALVGADTRTDLAVIKVNGASLPSAEFGDSTTLRIGEKAIAIGNPTGRMLSGSFTQGVISGVNRSIAVGTSGVTMEYIQTDAAINPGNSGGALVNKYGQVIGINSSKISSPDYEGIGFAIPIHEAQPIIENLMADGYVSGRVRIGITFTPITTAMAELTKSPVGLRVVEVDASTDAYAQGLRAGDIITHIDNQSVALLDDVFAILDDKKPLDHITLTVYRLKDDVMVTESIQVVLQEDASGRID